MSEITKIQKIGVLLLLLNGIGIGVTVYLFASTLNWMHALALTIFIYNSWKCFCNVVRWLDERQTNIYATIHLPSFNSVADREESLN